MRTYRFFIWLKINCSINAHSMPFYIGDKRQLLCLFSDYKETKWINQ